jgi:hypothetical protein
MKLSRSGYKRVEPCRTRDRLVVVLFVSVLCVVSAHAQTANAIWSGKVQCTLSLQFPGYSHQETQTWELTGEAPKMAGMAVYPAMWTVSGSGGGQRAVNGQFISSLWKLDAAPMSAPIAIFVRTNNRLVIKPYHAQLYSPKSMAITRQVSLPGVNPTQTTMLNAIDEWIMPMIEDANTSNDIRGSGTTPVGATSIPERPGGSNQMADCTWQFTRSSTASNSTGSSQLATPLQPVLGRSSSTDSVTHPASAASSGGSSNTMGTQGSSQAGTTALQMLPPGVSTGVRSISLSWKSPPNDGGRPVDSYEIEMNSGLFSSDLTTSGPVTSYVATASACPDPPVPCTPMSLKNYRFRVRAHNKSGPGPYSNYSHFARPKLSYEADGVSDIWRKLQCTSCHTRQKGSGHPPFLDESSSATYKNVVSAASVVATPGAASRLLTYPSHQNGHCGNTSSQFSVSSPEYMLVYQWIADGHAQ